MVDELLGLADAEPFRERRADLAARVLYAAGRQAEALRLIARTRARLLEELGLDPGPELVELEHRILRHDPELLPRPAAHDRRRGGAVSRRRHRPWSGGPRFSSVVGRAASPGRPVVVVLTGPPGMGKTRLLAECTTTAPRTALYGGCGGGANCRQSSRCSSTRWPYGRLGSDDLRRRWPGFSIAATA